MNKPIYLGLSILEISKIVMYEFWYDYMKPKYGDNVKLCYMDTDSFIIYIKTEDFYKDIADDVECKFDTSNYEVDRPLPTGKNDEVVLKSQQRFKSERHDVYTENVNKIALSDNDNKRFLTFDKITTYPYGYKGKHVKEIC